MNDFAPPPRPDTVRLNKRMSDLGLCSRREADDWIARGWVRVDGRVAPMGLQVGPQARIEVDPAARGQQQQQVTILLHKPVGYVSGQAEDGHQPAVTLVQGQAHWRGDPSRLRFAPGQLRGLKIADFGLARRVPGWGGGGGVGGAFGGGTMSTVCGTPQVGWC